jgi:hypothetical protein
MRPSSTRLFKTAMFMFVELIILAVLVAVVVIALRPPRK